ncbi:2409_t:CDS:2, partial [Gigaspora rosea]
PSVDEIELADESKSTDERKFWNSFNQALTKNISGINGMQRILFIIVDEFGPKKLQEKLKSELVIYYNPGFFSATLISE